MLSRTKPPVSQTEARRTASQFVLAGATDSEVRQILGPPDVIEAGEWIYFVDPRRGWSIVFTPAKTVERVDYWVS